MRTICLYIAAAAAAMTLTAGASAQENGSLRWEYWRHPVEYIHDQASVLLGYAGAVLDSEAPSEHPSENRRLALTALDAILHDTTLDGSDEFHAFVDARMEKLSRALGRKCGRGLEIYKVYNAGFVVRDKNLTVGFDLCARRGGMTIVADDVMEKIVGCCDVLFISHRDPDHADASVIEIAGRLGIPVYGPEDFPNPGSKGVRKEDFSSIELATKRGSVKTQPLPGHQDDLQNNIWVITFPSGKTVAQCGDQYNKDDLAWLGSAREKLERRLDVLIIDCWAMELQKVIEGFSPKAVISAHENEMGHSIDHREAFWMSLYKYDTLPSDAVIMAWGEGFTYR